MKKLILIILASGLLLQGCNYFKEHRLFSKKNVDTLQQITAEPNQATAVDTTTYSTPAVQEPGATTEVTNTPVENNNIAAASDKHYFMIVGSFLDQKNAERYAQKLRDMGYSPEILDASNGFHRVSARSYDNFKTGISEIPEFRSSVAPKAWVHVKK